MIGFAEPVRLHRLSQAPSSPHGSHIIGSLRTAESYSRHRWNSGLLASCVSSLDASSREADMQTPPRGLIGQINALRLPVPKDRNSCPSVHDPISPWPSPPRVVMSTPEPAYPRHTTKNKAPHTSLGANPRDADKSESKRILRRRSQNQDLKQ